MFLQFIWRNCYIIVEGGGKAARKALQIRELCATLLK